MVGTETYGTNSIKFQAINTWKKLQQTTNVDLTEPEYAEAKQKITEHLMSTYIT